MGIYYITNRKPITYNAKKGKETYKTQIREEFNDKFAKLYSEIPYKDKQLQSHVVYIHQLSSNIPDADNLSKPLVDAFVGVIYQDDSLVIRRTADILKLKEFDFLTVDATNMPYEVYDAFYNYYKKNEEHILFYEVGEFDPAKIRIGEL